MMPHYFPVIERRETDAERLASALQHGVVPPATVYVVGVSDEQAFANALTNGTLETEEITAVQALQYEYVEVIGKEDSWIKLPGLIERARARIEEIERNGTTRR